MTLSASLTSLEGIAEELRDHYVQKDGEYVLQVKSVNGLELANVQGLRNTVKTLRGEMEEIQGKVKTFDGLDPIVAREAMTKLKSIEEGKYEFDKDESFMQRLESERKKMAQKHNGEKEILEKQNNTLRSTLRQVFVEDVATKAIGEKKGNIRLLLPHMKSRMEAEEYEPGKFRTIILDKDGQKDIDAQGQSVTVNALMDEMEVEFPEAFPGPGSSGLGGGDDKKGKEGGAGTKKVIPKSDQDAMNSNLEDIASGKAVVDVDN